MATPVAEVAQTMLSIAVDEAQRIEAKYSRFITGNLLWQLNHSGASASVLDDETVRLMQFAEQCFLLSDGRFDISAGPLMAVWQFRPDSELPSEESIALARAKVGFERLQFSVFDEKACVSSVTELPLSEPSFSAQPLSDKSLSDQSLSALLASLKGTNQNVALSVPDGMHLDLGGIAKEYAVDNVAALLAKGWPEVSVLVNFGGDIACPVAKSLSEAPWQVGIENPNALDTAAAVLQIRQGALATSGDTRRFIERNGQRYGHIIDPSSGYPVINAPRSVTVLGPNCVMAGMLATMAMLQGRDAEQFLTEQNVQFKVFR